MIDREIMQMALDALEAALSNDQPYISRSKETAEALRARLAQPEQESAYGYASRLATAIWEKHYKDESPHWGVNDSLLGVLTQIDNMTTGLTKAQPEQEKTRSEKLRDAGYTRRPKGWDKDDGPEQEPVAWVAYENDEKHGIDFDEDEIAKLPVGTMLYTAPPQREWVGLTENDFGIWREPAIGILRWAEAVLKERNK